jgi:hypothetical protein
MEEYPAYVPVDNGPKVLEQPNVEVRKVVSEVPLNQIEEV